MLLPNGGSLNHHAGSGFSDVRQFQPGTRSSTVLVRLPQPGRVRLLNVLSLGFPKPRRGGLWKGL